MPYDRNVARIWAEKAREKVCSIQEASITSGIPYATMYRLVHDPKLIDRCPHGSKCTMNPEEAGLVKCCTWLNDRGVGVSKRDLLRAAMSLIERHGGSFGTKNWFALNEMVHRLIHRA